MRRVGIVGCSDRPSKEMALIQMELGYVFARMGLEMVFAPYLLEEGWPDGGERARAVNALFGEEEVGAVFDISGGDLGLEVLPYLDYSLIARSGKLFWGYSDLTVVLNAIYVKTGRPSILYQVRNLCTEEKLFDAFEKTLKQGGELLSARNLLWGAHYGALGAERREGELELFSFPYTYLQGAEEVRGILVGGNCRCLLKLAGTPYWPSLTGKVLLLESLGGEEPLIRSFFAQLSYMGVFHQVQSVILGTFTRLESQQGEESVYRYLRPYLPDDLPVVKTQRVGHGRDSYAAVVGSMIELPWEGAQG